LDERLIVIEPSLPPSSKFKVFYSYSTMRSFATLTAFIIAAISLTAAAPAPVAELNARLVEDVGSVLPVTPSGGDASAVASAVSAVTPAPSAAAERQLLASPVIDEHVPVGSALPVVAGGGDASAAASAASAAIPAPSMVAKRQLPPVPVGSALPVIPSAAASAASAAIPAPSAVVEEQPSPSAIDESVPAGSVLPGVPSNGDASAAASAASAAIPAPSVVAKRQLPPVDSALPVLRPSAAASVASVAIPVPSAVMENQLPVLAIDESVPVSSVLPGVPGNGDASAAASAPSKVTKRQIEITALPDIDQWYDFVFPTSLY
jgi:hypothetical protein